MINSKSDQLNIVYRSTEEVATCVPASEAGSQCL